MAHISYHASSERFKTQEEADTFGRKRAKEIGYIYLGVRAVMNCDVFEILHLNTEIPLRDDLKGRRHKTKGTWFNAIWASVDPDPIEPIRVGEGDGPVLLDGTFGQVIQTTDPNPS